ncbi:hypothetical protein MTP10_40105 [Nonomuraea sp. 3-1Str]|uniref:tetratricopeptide repeat protein n=1 Tax=Nonomuraea sp. 3-1Str TaxID=2929801 RepID=UPI00285586E6|nr:hypothetical protein [Nonomuraea sp. 3-1Str]MDR8414920.1 hypothetical protein [Nonomuraea sp. 3-1Str]
MTELPRDGVPCPFVMRLRELHALAGYPALSELCRLSRSNGPHLELRKSTVSDVLTGKRKRVPKWPFVYAFVTACAAAARQAGLDVGGMGDVQTWNEHWRAAQDAGGAAAALTPLPALSGATALAVAAPATTMFASAPRTVADHETRAMTGYAARAVAAYADQPVAQVPEQGPDPVEPVSEEDRELLRIYGRTGLRLLRRSDPGDGLDCMRLAVVTLLRNQPDVARDWLRRAGDAGRHEATELFNHPRPQERAAGHAYLHGVGYQEADPPRPSCAMFFFRLAADRGHAGAAYRLARAHRAKREDTEAEKWLRRAADAGHPLAASVLAGARTPSGAIDAALLAELLDGMPAE